LDACVAFLDLHHLNDGCFEAGLFGCAALLDQFYLLNLRFAPCETIEDDYGNYNFANRDHDTSDMERHPNSGNLRFVFTPTPSGSVNRSIEADTAE
jgi:hypothetical protein